MSGKDWSGHADFDLGFERGLRCFRVAALTERDGNTGPWRLSDKLDGGAATGTLTGIYYRQPFAPGWTEAKCLVGNTSGLTCGHQKHAAPQPDCACGIHAYLYETPDAGPPVNTYITEPPFYVQGVIEGAGRCLVGEKGFRCAKAKIVALILPVLSHRANMADQLGDVGIELSRRVVALYPDAATFTSIEDAVREYPLSTAEAPPDN